MFDFIVLTIILLSIAALIHQNAKGKYYEILLSFGILFVMYAFRGESVGNDTTEYIRIFNQINVNKSFTYQYSRYELGYLFLNYALKYIGCGSQVIFVVVGAFIYYSFGRFIINYSKIPWLSVFIFFTYGLFTFTFTALRQGMAMAICLFAFDALLKDKNLKFFTLVILATLFHSTAIIFILAFWCKFIKPSRKLFIIGYISSFIILIVFSTVLNYIFQMLPMYEHYAGGSYIGVTGSAAYLYASLSSIILLFSFNRFHKVKIKNTIINRFDTYGLIMILFAVILYIISIKANIFDRMAIYFNMLAIFILPNAISLLKKQKRTQAIIISIIVFFLYQATIIYLRPEWVSIFPYSFYR